MWFALDDNRALFAFAGIWTEFKGAIVEPSPSPSRALT
jgi:putative SOS response-associated peptidase YedK